MIRRSIVVASIAMAAFLFAVAAPAQADAQFHCMSIGYADVESPDSSAAAPQLCCGGQESDGTYLGELQHANGHAFVATCKFVDNLV